MRTDPLRVAGWSVVAMGALIFFGAAWRIVTDVPVAVPTPTATVTVQQTFAVTAPGRAPVMAETEAVEDAAYVGNTNTHRFHRKSCTYAGCKNCTAEYGSRQAAIEDGYRPCAICDP